MTIPTPTGERKCCVECSSDPHGMDYSYKEKCLDKDCPCHLSIPAREEERTHIAREIQEMKVSRNFPGTDGGQYDNAIDDITHMLIGRCRECGSAAEEENTRVGIGLCQKCDAKNWITDPAEIQKEIGKDPELSKGTARPSPYQDPSHHSKES